MPDTPLFNEAERELDRRYGQKLVNMVLSRDDGRTHESHYLISEFPSTYPNIGPKVIQEIERFRDIERVVAAAADFETKHRDGRWIGGFSATYRDGMLTSMTVIANLAERVAEEVRKRPEDRIGALRGLRLHPSAREMAKPFEEAAAEGLRQEASAKRAGDAA